MRAHIGVENTIDKFVSSLVEVWGLDCYYYDHILQVSLPTSTPPKRAWEREFLALERCTAEGRADNDIRNHSTNKQKKHVTCRSRVPFGLNRQFY